MLIAIAQGFLPAFTVPGLAAAGAAAISIPIAIHLLARRKRKTEPWAAMRFILAAYKKHRQRIRLEQLLLLLVRCLIVMLAGMALAGPQLRELGAAAGLGGGRTVYLVIDNGITSSAPGKGPAGPAGTGGVTRLDELKKAGLAVLESLGAGDRAALITAAKPSEALIDPPSSDIATLRREVEGLSASAAAADLPAALDRVMTSLEREKRATGMGFVVLLSDFSAGAVRMDKALGERLRNLGSLARLVRVTGAGEAPNIQIESIVPGATVVYSESPGQGPVVDWQIKLRRFGTSPPSGPTTLRLSLPGEPVIRQTINWAAGQATSELRISTTLKQTGPVALTAALEAAADDGVKADNQRAGVVEARQKLNVLLVSRGGGQTAGGRLTPERWLRAVLDPVGDPLAWPIQVHAHDPGSLNETMLRGMDVAFIMDGQAMDAGGWDLLARWTGEGGVTWVIPAAATITGAWPSVMSQKFGQTWKISPEATKEKEPIRLATDGPTPEAWTRIRSDLRDLLSPVEILQRLGVEAATIDSHTQVLLRTETDAPILLSAPVNLGAGRLIFLTVSLDPIWTNLPTKPLMVPLVHETMRASLNGLTGAQDHHVGDQPELKGKLGALSSLIGPDGKQMLLVAVKPEKPPAGGQEPKDPKKTEAAKPAVRPIRPLDQPGLYKGGDEILAVNIDSPAANTMASAEPVISSYLATAGEWAVAEDGKMSEALKLAEGKADMGWPLLWVVLALALLETYLARVVSHAGAAPGAGAQAQTPGRAATAKVA